VIVFPRGEVKTWRDLTPGALFGLSIGGETHLGVKIQGSGGGFHCAVLTGFPPRCVSENVVQNSRPGMTLPQTPALATDCVVFDRLGRVLLIRRGHEPGAGKHALPGGFVKIGETVISACRREVKEETGIDVAELTLVGVYSDIDRDPRGHIVSVAFMTELANETRPRVGSDAMSAEWVDTRDVDLAFDHARTFADAKAKLRGTP